MSMAEDQNEAVVSLNPAADPTIDTIPYGKKRATELISCPKPIPANALCLQLTDPFVAVAIPVQSPSNTSESESDAAVRRHVRFRSRFRITSGFSHHRRESDAGSSRSGSSSSSISVPLRSHPHGDINTWGQRGSLLALQKKILGASTARQRHTQEPIRSTESVNEHTPLRNSFNKLPYVEGNGVREVTFNEYSDDRRLEVDVVFGKFPGRLLNPRWWYWQLKLAVCCHRFQ